jgi:hypothetical protein
MEKAAARRNVPLIFGGGLSLIAAMLHVAIIIGGPDWYRAFGAGEELAAAAALGAWWPGALTAAIAAGLTVFALYAFSGAGLIARLPFLKPALAGITLLYLARGIGVVPLFWLQPEVMDAFMIWSSAVVTVYGAFHAIGTWQVWRGLGARN